MSWMTSIFGAKPVEQSSMPVQQTTQTPVNQNPTPQNPNDITQKTEQTDANGVVPKQETKPVSPLDEHKNLWQTPEVKKPEQSQEVTLTPEKMFESAAKIDFSKILDKDQLDKVKAGGEEAVGALVQLLNRTAQGVYGQSMVAAKKMVDTAVEAASSKFTSKVPDLLRNQTAQAELYKTNPALNNPVLAPIIEAIQTQLSQHKPNATADELKNMSMSILQASANLINPASNNSSDSNSNSAVKGKKKEKEEDWLEWINYDSNKQI